MISYSHVIVLILLPFSGRKPLLPVESVVPCPPDKLHGFLTKDLNRSILAQRFVFDGQRLVFS